MRSFISTWIARSFAICLSSLALSSTLHACGPDFSGYYFTWMLQQYTPGDVYYDLQFDPNSSYYGRDWQYEERGGGPQDNPSYNLNLWRKYLDLPHSTNDSILYRFIYLNNSNDIKNLRSNGTGAIEKRIQVHAQGDQIIRYLELLQQYKEVMAPPADTWDYASYTKALSPEKTSAYLNACENFLTSTKDPFLQWRTLYLLLRTTHFNKQHAPAVRLYEKYNNTLQASDALPRYWCEGIYAGALLRTGVQDKAIYHAARAFVHCPDQALKAMNTYLFTNRKWWTALPHCRTAGDTVSVVMLEGANHPYPNMDFIRMVYNVQPGSDVLKLLWLRETAKVEEFILNRDPWQKTFELYNSKGDPVDIDSIYKTNKTLQAYEQLGSEIMLAASTTAVKASVGNALAYYYYRTEKFKEAAHYLGMVKSAPKSEIENRQYQLLSKLVQLKQYKEFDSRGFMELSKELAASNQSLNRHVAHFLLYNEIAPHFLKQQDSTTAFWAYVWANVIEGGSFDLYHSDYSPQGWNNYNYATYLLNHRFSHSQVDRLKEAFNRQQGAHEFETFLIQQSKLEHGAKMFDLVHARKYMLDEQWDKATAILPLLPDEFVNQMGPNPANFKLNDTIEDNAGQKNNFTVKQILELSQKLKELADAPGKGHARDKLLYATLLYNLSFYGKNHYLLDNHWNHYGSRNTAYYLYDSVDAHMHLDGRDTYQQAMHGSYRNYFYLFTTERYATDALNELESDEERARCVFLAAKCWQKRCPLELQFTDYGYRENVSDYTAYSMKNPYFATLARSFGSTAFYREAMSNCSYLRLAPKK